MRLPNLPRYILMSIVLVTFSNLYSASVHIHNESVTFERELQSWEELKNTNLTRQKYDYSCGAASLSTILSHYYGISTSEREILDWVLESKGINVNLKAEVESNEHLREMAHLSFLDLAHYAQHKGFRTMGLALDLPTLSTLKAPVIIYVNVRDVEHFSVYKGIDEHYVYLADPSFGNIKVSIAKFVEMFYKREDLSYPGKILAILPGSAGAEVNAEFMQKHRIDTFLLEVLVDNAMR